MWCLVDPGVELEVGSVGGKLPNFETISGHRVPVVLDRRQPPAAWRNAKVKVFHRHLENRKKIGLEIFCPALIAQF